MIGGGRLMCESANFCGWILCFDGTEWVVTHHPALADLIPTINS